MGNILPCPILSYILLPPFIHSLIYILHSPAYFTPLLYTLLYTYYYIFLYIPFYIPFYILSTLLYTLLFSNSIINLAPPPFYTSPLSYTLLYTCPSYFHIPLLSYSFTPILLYPLSYIERGITTLPPIFTRFTSLS